MTKLLDGFLFPPFGEQQQREKDDSITPVHFVQGAQWGGLHPVKICRGMNVPCVLELQEVVNRLW